MEKMNKNIYFIRFLDTKLNGNEFHLYIYTYIECTVHMSVFLCTCGSSTKTHFKLFNKCLGFKNQLENVLTSLVCL